MLLLKNTGTNLFKSLLKEKRVFVFGAGKALESCIDIYFSETDLVAIVDNNQSLWGKKIEHRGKLVSVVGVPEFIKIVTHYTIKKSVLMIATPYYAAEIIQQLDEIPELFLFH
ncbi:MAG: hypothetical protein K6E51_14785 [Treponema sp.]|nr:hypothetical protein [Treponema sp.]